MVVSANTDPISKAAGQGSRPSALVLDWDIYHWTGWAEALLWFWGVNTAWIGISDNTDLIYHVAQRAATPQFLR